MQKLSDVTYKKFIEQNEVPEWEVETEEGWVDIISSNKTIEYEIYEITLDNGLSLKCADNHILIKDNYEEIYAKDSLGEYIRTKEGISQVIHVNATKEYDNMYDLSVNSENHTYYTNDILSHNTTTSCIFILHHILFNSHKTVAILANKGATAREILSRVQLAYEHLPKWLQQGVVEWNKGSIELENGSKVLSAATSSTAIRGFSISTLFIDEAAFIPKNQFDDFFTSVYPTISSGKKSKIIIISTANGFNHFYKMVDDARNARSTFKIFEVVWSDVPHYDEEWKNETISNIGEMKFRQEYANEFLGTSNTLIAMNILNAMVHKNPIKIDNNGSIKIYKEVQEGNQYVITLDPSEGVGGDFHACSVIDISQLPYEQVATYRNNMDSPSGVVPEIIWKLSEYYNSALILVESNISAGHEIAKILHEELESENVLMTTMKGRKGQIISTGFGNSGLGYGVRMTKSVKKIGCSKLKDLIETGNFIVNDFDTKSELSKFVRVRDSFAADANESDDTVMSLVLFSWLTNQDFFKNINEKITRKLIYKEQLEAIEENLLPIGFFPDSHMDEEEEIWSEYQMLPY